MNKKTFIIDLDGTIISQKSIVDYDVALPKFDIINKVNKLFDAGHHIIIYTARGMNSYFGDVKLIELNLRKVTEETLNKFGVKYTSLIFGKLCGDYYVDDKNLLIDEFLKIEL